MAKETELDISTPVSRPSWLNKLKGKPTPGELSEKDVEQAAEDIEKEPNLAKNGWSPKTLASYYKERELAGPTGRPPKIKPTRTNGWHNPHKWRK
jgi:hypothetical protein